MTSTKYKMWRAILDLKTCFDCRSLHGKIFLANKPIEPRPPLHLNCRCVIEFLKALFAGTATNKGTDGADGGLKIRGNYPIIISQGQKQKNLDINHISEI